MTPSDRDVMTAKWQLVGDELRLGNGDDISLNFKKTTSEMAAKFDTWSKDKEMIEVPQPAKYTIFVYGNAGGHMDYLIEHGFWEETQKFLKDHNNVRVVCLYKYGKDNVDEEGNHSFTGQYADPGDIVWFELTDKFDLNKVRENGMQAIGMGEEAKKLKLCDPNTLRMFLEFSSIACPAENYSLVLWGHGAGFFPLKDVPGKYEVVQPAPTRGVLVDEWNDKEWMDMYELVEAIQSAGIDRFNTLMFHNCLMGNIESLTQVRNVADYIMASAHVLISNGTLLTEFVRGLMESGNAETAAGLTFERSKTGWEDGYSADEPHEYNNGDFKMIRSDKIDAVVDAAKNLATRLIALYPTQKEAIDRATAQVYRFQQGSLPVEYPYFDIADYAHLLAKETGDEQIKTISDALDNTFKEAFVHYRDISNSKDHLDHYTLSVTLIDQPNYIFDYSEIPSLKALCKFNEGYEQCDFHKLTGWGNWLNTNEQPLDSNPCNGQGGKLE